VITAVFNVSALDVNTYIINGKQNPTINLKAGNSYEFNIYAPANPFWIKTVSGNGVNNGAPGVVGNGVDAGQIYFTVPATGAQPQYFYNCEFHPAMNGALTIGTFVPSSTVSSSSGGTSSGYIITPHITLLIVLSAVCIRLMRLLI